MKTQREDKPVGPEMDDIDDIDARTEMSRLHVRDKPDVLFAPAPSIVENIFFSMVGHTFGPLYQPVPGGPQRYIVQDFLLDQTGASGADGKMDNLKSFD